MHSDEKSKVSYDELVEGSDPDTFSVEVTEVLPDPFAKILDTLRDPHATVTAVRQTFGLLALRHSIDADALELRTGLKSEHDLHYQIGTTLPASTTGAATDLDTLRDPHATVTAVRQTFGLLALRHSIDADALELRTGLKSEHDLHYQIGTTLPASTTGAATDHWRSLGGFYLTHRFQDVELRDASWHERRYTLKEINAIVDAWVRKRI